MKPTSHLSFFSVLNPTRLTGLFQAPLLRFMASLLVLVFTTSSFLGAPPATATIPDKPKTPLKNLIPNGNFERVTSFPNLYDGVDSQGFLKVPRCNSKVYLSGSEFSSIAFTASPSYEDINGDGKPDLIVSSPLGSLFWFANVGTKEVPAFDKGVLVQSYLGTAARICVADWNNDSKLDIIFGNIEGNINVLINIGSAANPKWAEQDNPRWFPPTLDGKPSLAQSGLKALVLQHNKEPINIGVYSAPTYADWNKDGLQDLIVGEGSYSANSIRIWLNTGTRTSPSFSLDSPFFLAYGDGREQLSPYVYDWNNDGFMDLIVGDREGRVALYLGTEASIKNPKKVEPVEFTKFIPLSGREAWGSLISLQVCDYNSDGIPDILYGTTAGTVLVALGKGSRQDAQFDSSSKIKATDFAKDFKQPSSWDNAPLAFATDGDPYTGTAPLPESISLDESPDAPIREASKLEGGKRALHLTWFDKFWGWSEFQPTILGLKPGYLEGVFQINNQILPFILGKDYEFSFWHKGSNMRIGYSMGYQETYQDPKRPTGPPLRGLVMQFSDSTVAGSNWSQYKRTYRFPGTKDKDIDTNDGKHKMDSATIQLYLIGTGDVWIDDMELIEVQK